MQEKQAIFCTGCWRLTLLSCVLALHLIPLSVRGKKLPFTVQFNHLKMFYSLIFLFFPFFLSFFFVKFLAAAASQGTLTHSHRAARKEVSEALIVG